MKRWIHSSSAARAGPQRDDRHADRCHAISHGDGRAASAICDSWRCVRFVCAMPSAPTILLFDSGLGGLTVLREVAAVRPDARLVYVADDVFFPYGRKTEPALIARVLALMTQLIETH